MEGKAAANANEWGLMEGLAYSSLGVALAAACMTAACGTVMRGTSDPRLLGLAFAGTLAIYTTDRLRDLERDKITAPLRSRFIEQFMSRLKVQTALALMISLGLGLAAGPRVVALAAGVALLGLAHRRLKGFAGIKAAYITVAWTAVAAGLPAARDPDVEHLPWVALLVAGTITSNVMLSNLRDGEGSAGHMGHTRALIFAGLNLLPTASIAWFGPDAVRPLILLPLCMLGAVIGFRPSERYGAVAVDGALVVGGLGAWLWASQLPV